MRPASTRSTAALVAALLPLTLIVGCGGSDADSETSRSATAVTSTSAPSTTSPRRTTTTESTTSTTAVATTTRPAPATTTTAAAAASGPVYCTGVRTADSQWELAEASIGWLTDRSAIVFTGNARGGRWDGLDWGYSFEIGELTSVVVLGTYGDGTPNSFVQGPDTPDDNYLEDAYTFEGNASAAVPASWLGDIPAGTPWTVRLLVGGTEVGSCSASF